MNLDTHSKEKQYVYSSVFDLFFICKYSENVWVKLALRRAPNAATAFPKLWNSELEESASTDMLLDKTDLSKLKRLECLPAVDL